MAKKYHELHVAGVIRRLPVINLNDRIAIAGFVILGDTELTEKTAQALAEKIPKDAEIIMTAETKGIPLAASMARLLHMPFYVIARKSVKAYMENPIWVEDASITTAGKQWLYLMDADIQRMQGKKVLLVDDVISTGSSMKALKELAEKAGGQVVGEAAILAEGDAAERKDIIYLEALPLFEAE